MKKNILLAALLAASIALPAQAQTKAADTGGAAAPGASTLALPGFPIAPVAVSQRPQTDSEKAETAAAKAAEDKARAQREAAERKAAIAAKQRRSDSGATAAEAYFTSLQIAASRADAGTVVPKWRKKNEATLIGLIKRRADIVSVDADLAWRLDREYFDALTRADFAPIAGTPPPYAIFIGKGFNNRGFVDWVKKQSNTLPVAQGIALLDAEIKGLKALENPSKWHLETLNWYATARTVLADLQ